MKERGKGGGGERDSGRGRKREGGREGGRDGEGEEKVTVTGVRHSFIIHM